MKEEQQDNSQNDQQNDQDIEIVEIDDVSIPDKKVPSLPQPLLALVPRQRRIQAFVTVSLVVLVLIALLGSNISIRNKVIQAVVPPTPTPIAPIPHGTDNFYASRDVGWGHLFVDGKLISNVPDAYDNNGNLNAPIHLARGTHTLLWRADPFPSQTCTISVPNNYRTDTCKYNNFESGDGWVIPFPSDITVLSATLRGSLLAAVQAALQSYASTDIVQPSERYTTDLVSKQQATAQEPLKVTLHYELDTDMSSSFAECSPFNFDGGQGCIIRTQDCRTFCFASPYFNTASTQTWDVFAAARSIWDYTTLTGKSIVQHQVDRVNATFVDHLIPLQISWDGKQWHVKSSFSLLADNSVQSFTASICDSSTWDIPTPVDEAQATASWNVVAASKATTGCLGIATLDLSQVAHPPQTPALFLYRFGVFLAANDVAHHYWPTTQLADAYAQQLAQQLYKTSKQHLQTG
jgi:hypothetical protein